MFLTDRWFLLPSLVTKRFVNCTNNIFENWLTELRDQRYIPMKRSALNHLYFPFWNLPRMHLKKKKLSARFCPQIFHPTSKKIFTLTFDSRLEEKTPYILKNIEDISKGCNPNQRIKHTVVLIRVDFGKGAARSNIKFSWTLLKRYISSAKNQKRLNQSQRGRSFPEGAHFS